MRLEGRNIIVTGGSTGIGLAIAEDCARNGATVVIAARNPDDLKQALQKLKEVSTAQHQSYSLDVSDTKAVTAFARWVSDKFSKIHGIVNCAGVYGPIGRTPEVELEKFKQAIEINFLGAVYMTHEFVPLLDLKSRPSIVNIAGGGAASAFPHYSAYATSKAALVRFSENLALELKEQGIRVNSVAPGFVITRLHQETIAAGAETAGAAFYENTARQISKGGVPPEKAAKLSVFLLSEESVGITGKFISAPWDEWNAESFQATLRSDPDFATLRRIDNFQFFKKSSE